MRKDKILRDNIKKEIVRGIKNISYGEIIITIHDSRIVQIEKREKKRFNLR